MTETIKEMWEEKVQVQKNLWALVEKVNKKKEYLKITDNVYKMATQTQIRAMQLYIHSLGTRIQVLEDIRDKAKDKE